MLSGLFVRVRIFKLTKRAICRHGTCVLSCIILAPNAKSNGRGIIRALFSRVFHAFHHTFASMLNHAHVPLATAQRLLRHSDPKLTAKIYTHVMLADKAEELSKLPKIEAVHPESLADMKTGTDDLMVPAESTDRPADRNGSDSMDKITTYSDNQTPQNDAVIAFSEKQKNPAAQGQTGLLIDGAGEPAHTIGTTRVVIRWRLSAGRIARTA